MKLTKEDTILYGYTDRSSYNDYGRQGYAEIKHACLVPSDLYNGLKLETKVKHMSDATQLLDVLSNLAGINKYANLVVYFHNLKLDASYLRSVVRQKNSTCISYNDYHRLLPILQMLKKINANASDNNQDGLEGLKWKLEDKRKKLIKPDKYVNIDNHSYYLTVEGYIEIYKMLSNAWIDMVNDAGVIYESIYISDSFNPIHFRDSLKFFDIKMDQMAKQANVENYRDENDMIDHNDGWVPSHDDIVKYEGNVTALKTVVDKYIQKSTAWEIKAKRKPSLRMTRSAYAYNRLRSTLYASQTRNMTEAEQEFDRQFPSIEIGTWENLRRALVGGLVYVKPHASRYLDVGRGIAIDNNSEYSAAMCSDWFPCGKPSWHEGDMHDHIRSDRTKHMYIQAFTAKFRLKKNGIPMISKEYSTHHQPVISNNDLDRFQQTILLCDVDFSLFEKNYDIISIDYLYYYRFKAVYKPFKNYIETASAKKIHAAKMIAKYQEEGNDDEVAYWTDIKREAKVDINALPGKFSQKILNKINKIVTNVYGESKLDSDEGYTLDSSKYIPIAIWTNAYAREILFSGIDAVGSRFLYCDTDSVHFLGWDIPDKLSYLIDQFRLGYWKIDSKYRKARYIREKCYAEEIEKYDEQGNIVWETEAKVSGLSDASKRTEIRNVEDLKYTDERKPYSNNLVANNVSGGLVLTLEDRDLLPRTSSAPKYVDHKMIIDKLNHFLQTKVKTMENDPWNYDWKIINEREASLLKPIIGYYNVMIDDMDAVINLVGIDKAKRLVNKEVNSDKLLTVGMNGQSVQYITINQYQRQMTQLINNALLDLYTSI